MAFSSAFLRLMTQTITIAAVTSRDEYNARTYGTAVSYRCRVVEKAERFIDSEGREAVATTVIWAKGHDTSGIPDVGPDSRLTLPDGTQPAIVGIEVYPDMDGDHHFKILCDRARVN